MPTLRNGSAKDKRKWPTVDMIIYVRAQFQIYESSTFGE